MPPSVNSRVADERTRHVFGHETQLARRVSKPGAGRLSRTGPPIRRLGLASSYGHCSEQVCPGHLGGEDHGMNQSVTQTAAERESLRPECRADAARLERLLAPDFHEFGTSGREIGYEGTATRVAEETDPNGEPILVENMRGWLLAEGLVMLKYVSENSGRRSNRTSLWRRVEPGHW